MATYRLRHFSNPATLRSIEPSRLSVLLEPYRGFFDVRGYPLPVADEGREFDYQVLVDIFSTPDTSTPVDLLDALFLIDEMSTPDAMDTLVQAAADEGIFIDPNDEHSAADIAVQIWNANREILERKHAEQFLRRPKSFEYFQSSSSDPLQFNAPTEPQRQRLERDLDDWFEQKRRGRGARVFIYEDDEEVRFLVRHGEPFKREESINGNGVASVCYRPLKYDVVVYHRGVQELRINAQLVGEKRLYCEKFGLHFFGDPDRFPGTRKYTLEPLRELGEDSLSCGDIDGIESITLNEVSMFWGGAHGEIEIRKAGDLFAALSARNGSLPIRPRIISAKFKVKFADSNKPRSVSIRPGNIAQYMRDADAGLIERWLVLRGFICHEHAGQYETAAASMAGA